MVDSEVVINGLDAARNQVKEAPQVVPQSESAERTLAQEVAATRKEFEQARAKIGDFYTALGQGPTSVMVLNEPVFFNKNGTQKCSTVMLTSDGFMAEEFSVGHEGKTPSEVVESGKKMIKRLQGAKNVVYPSGTEWNLHHLEVEPEHTSGAKMSNYQIQLDVPTAGNIQESLKLSIERAQQPHVLKVDRASQAVGALSAARSTVQSSTIK